MIGGHTIQSPNLSRYFTISIETKLRVYMTPPHDPNTMHVNYSDTNWICFQFWMECNFLTKVCVKARGVHCAWIEQKGWGHIFGPFYFMWNLRCKKIKLQFQQFKLISSFSSFDVRSRNPNDAVHWSDDQYFGKRAHFRIGSDSTVLLISKVQIEVRQCRAVAPKPTAVILITYSRKEVYPQCA